MTDWKQWQHWQRTNCGDRHDRCSSISRSTVATIFVSSSARDKKHGKVWSWSLNTWTRTTANSSAQCLTTTFKDVKCTSNRSEEDSFGLAVFLSTTTLVFHWFNSVLHSWSPGTLTQCTRTIRYGDIIGAHSYSYYLLAPILLLLPSPKAHTVTEVKRALCVIADSPTTLRKVAPEALKFKLH